MKGLDLRVLKKTFVQEKTKGISKQKAKHRSEMGKARRVNENAT